MVNVRLAIPLNVVALVIVAGCSSITGGSGATNLPIEESGERISAEQFFDPEFDLGTASGLDLGELTPPDSQPFCEAVPLTPSLWLDDAIVPIQYWHDNFRSVEDLPVAVIDDRAALLEYAQLRLAWHFGRGERPAFDQVVVDHLLAIADAAAERCDDLPLVFGRSDEQLMQSSMDEAEISESCAEDHEVVAAGIARYLELRGEEPQTLDQLEVYLFEESFVSFELHGVMLNDEGQAIVVPVEIGPCGDR